MKNLIINIFKTLFFFDLAVILITLLPEVQNKNPALQKLIEECLPLGIVLILTLLFILVIERKKLKLPIERNIPKSLLWGLITGSAIPVVFLAVTAATKHFSFISFIKTEHLIYWILGLLANAIFAEALFRGYLFVLYKKFYGFIFATVVTTLLYLSFNFAIFSESKNYIANIILFNVLLCFLLEYSNSIITTITARFVYTVLSGLMLGSIPLANDYPTIINHTFKPHKILIGKDVPIEKSTFVLIVLIVLTVLFVHKKYDLIAKFKLLIKYIKQLPYAIRKLKSLPKTIKLKLKKLKRKKAR